MALSRRLATGLGAVSKRVIDLLQLVDRAAEALAVLLREFRALRGDDAAEQAQPEGG